VFQESYNLGEPEELLHARNLIGEAIDPLAENSWMILNYMDLKHLHLLSTSGASVPEILHTAKLKSNGNAKCYQEMNFLMENVYGTMATLER
jgi:hypothetical protein